MTADSEHPLATARALLGDDAPAPDAPLRAVAAALAARLAAAGDAQAPDDDAAHCVMLARERAAADAHLEAFARIEAAIERLREITAPAVVLGTAPAVLGAASSFDRILLSSVHEGRIEEQVVWLRDDERDRQAALAALRANPMRLAHPLVEVELLRRRRPLLVADVTDDLHLHAPTVAFLGGTGYVAAPVLERAATIALLHAARSDGPPLDRQDADVVEAFARGVGQAHERAALRRTLRRERGELRRVIEWLDLRSAEVAGASIELDAPPAAAAPAAAAATGPVPGAVDTLVFDGVLTRRELEVLRLLADGRSNRAIADELVVSAGTVKFHVNRVLTKLRAANRAEAASRYHELMGAGRGR